MITLYELINPMSLECEIEIYGDSWLDILAEGERGSIDIPDELLDTEVVHYIPGIVTKILIREPKY